MVHIHGTVIRRDKGYILVWGNVQLEFVDFGEFEGLVRDVEFVKVEHTF